MNDSNVCLATNWWQFWLHWRQWQINRMPEVVHRRGALVIVKCMRQYTENSPGGSTAKYTNLGGRREYTAQCWKPPSCQMNWNWPYWYCNWPYQFSNWLYQYRLQYTFRGKSMSIRVYAIADTHWVFFVFCFPRNWNHRFPSSHAAFHKFFPYQFLLRG